MIWMIQQISIYILCYLFICLLIGSILFLIWKILCKKMEEKGFVRLNYGLLKIVMHHNFDRSHQVELHIIVAFRTLRPGGHGHYR